MSYHVVFVMALLVVALQKESTFVGAEPHGTSTLAPQFGTIKSDATPLTDTSITYAVNQWFEDPTISQTVFGHISDWNVSLVTDFSFLFHSAESFDEDLSRWDVSSALNMESMFYGASSFTSDLSQWNTSSVEDTSHMFHGASSFTSNLSQWDTTKVFDFSYMFHSATSFNGDVSTWDITNSFDLSFLFFNATSFNGDISQWTIEKGTQPPGLSYKWAQDMESMFHGASSFSGDLSAWETFAAINMKSMFQDASSFDSDLSSWNVGLVRDFSYMFSGSDFSGVVCWEIDANATTTGMFDDSKGSFGMDCNETNEDRLVSSSGTVASNGVGWFVFTIAVVTMIGAKLI